MNKSLRIVFACALLFNLASCGGGGGGSSGSTAPSCSSGSSAGSGSASVTALKYTDTVVGTGAAAADGNTLTVNYTGWLYSSTATNNEGTEFGTSGGTPFSFVLGNAGAGGVIPGWNQGLVGMQAGGTRILIIPSSLAYGSCPAPGSPIPPDSALVFQVTLNSIN